MHAEVEESVIFLNSLKVKTLRQKLNILTPALLIPAGTNQELLEFQMLLKFQRNQLLK